MGIKKILTVIFLPLLLASFLCSQNLVELAKKEKERRAKLKGKKGIVVTNADLTRLRKKPALSITGVKLAAMERPPATATIRPESRLARKSSKGIDKEESGNLQELEQKWKKTKEYVDLLTLKINGLRQKFYSFRDWTLRDSIQREISETFLKLQKAKLDSEKTKKELDRQRIKKRR